MSGKGRKTENRRLYGRLSGGMMAVIAGMVVYSVVIGGLTIRRYDTYNSGAYDLGIMEQTLWNTSHGRLLTESVNRAYPFSRLWDSRWELIYIPIAMMYRVFPSPAAGLIFQTLMLALGALPLYLIGRRRLGPGVLPVAIAFAYLLFPALHNANLFDIHGITFATPMILFAFYFLQERRKGLFYLFIFLLLTCREDASFAAFMLGLYAALVTGRRRAGVMVMCLSVGWFFMTQEAHLLRPVLGLPNVEDPNAFPGRWKEVGGSSPVSFLIALLSDPIPFFKALWSVGNLKLLTKLFAPVCFLSFLSPSSCVLMLPNLLINMISNSPVAKNIYHHYTGAITPVVFISAALGVGNLLDWHRARRNGDRQSLARWGIDHYILSIAILSSTAVAACLWSRVPDTISLRVTPHDRSNDSTLAEIPGNASVSAHFFLVPHVAERQGLYLFPDGVGKAEYIVYDLNLPFNRLMTHRSQSKPATAPVNPTFLSLLEDRRYGVIDYRDGTLIFKKGADYYDGLLKLADGRAEDFKPLIADFDLGVARLLGFRVGGISGFSERQLHLLLFWEWQKEGGGGRDLFVVLDLQRNGLERRFRHRPFFGKVGSVEWDKGTVIRDDLFLPLTGLEAGDYRVYLVWGTGSEGTGALEYLMDLNISTEDLLPGR